MKAWTVLLAALTVIATPLAIAEAPCAIYRPEQFLVKSREIFIQKATSDITLISDLNLRTAFKGGRFELALELARQLNRYRADVAQINALQLERFLIKEPQREWDLSARASYELMVLKVKLYNDIKALFGGHQTGLFLYHDFNTRLMSPSDEFLDGVFMHITKEGYEGFIFKDKFAVTFDASVRLNPLTKNTEVCINETCLAFNADEQVVPIHPSLDSEMCYAEKSTGLRQ
ncbi:MAG: hypothetical protein KF799_14440 [Bdellovibrionales bacterium]|nr:hypothetical protein [Bdellovibrionales bacterium]